jgi:glucose-6-phosphate dehydrogenase assembly protein OpcA
MSNQQSILLDEPREVDIAAIERELTLLWKEAAEPTEAGGAPVVRACSLNLIVVVGNDSEVAPISDIVGDVSLEHPSRIFLVVADDRGAASSIDAYISARCSIPVPGGKQVCCEQINLTAKGADTAKIPSIVTSLLVADVPSVLIWKGRVHEKDVVLNALIEIADRTLIDSSEDPSPQASLMMWQRLIERNSSRGSFGDLAWAHCTTWRSALAGVFAPADARPMLSIVRGVRIEYSTSRSPRHSGLSQTMLIIGWLVQSLGWKTVYHLKETAGGIFEATMREEQREISIVARPVAPVAAKPGGLHALTMHAQGFELNIRLGTSANCIHISTNVDGHAREDVVPVMHQSEADLIAHELEDLGSDALYLRSLASLVALLKE